MPEFFLELFSEEIPKRLQFIGADAISAICISTLAPLDCAGKTLLYGSRRIAFSAEISPQVPARNTAERGPRTTAPDQAISGFLRKHNATRDQLVQEGDFWVLYKVTPGSPARALILETLPIALAAYTWPKSMRWGQSGEFTWVRPLRRITCLLDGEIIPITLGPITASNETEGHRIHRPGPFTITSVATWEESLREHYVIADPRERKRKIADGIAKKAAELGLSVAPDDALLDEVTGLVEWPVPLIGKIDDKFMDLPPEVRELSMKVNQKYFALRNAQGHPAPYFAFVANLEASDGGAAIVAGNERVLRARLSDARYFWDTDLKTPLNQSLEKLKKITFHAKIGTQYERVGRLESLTRKIVTKLSTREIEIESAHAAALFCKADLVTLMVGEFPELQGIIGGYYAEKMIDYWNPGADIDPKLVGQAIKTHYQPKGPNDAVPKGVVAASVALADKLDTLVEFFRINEKPTGSGDPYALRRAALGVIRIVLENRMMLQLSEFIEYRKDVIDFIIERLRVKLRGQGERFDILDAVLNVRRNDDLFRVMQWVYAIRDFLDTPDGSNLLSAYRRGVNILTLEEAKDGCIYSDPYRWDLLKEPEEFKLAGAIREQSNPALTAPDRKPWAEFNIILQGLSRLNAPINEFLDNLPVNSAPPEIRQNRLLLLAGFRRLMHQIADFSKIEG